MNATRKKALFFRSASLTVGVLVLAALSYFLPFYLFCPIFILGICFCVIRSLYQTEESRERLDLILSSVEDALLFTDLQGRVLLTNPAAERLLQAAGAGSDKRPVSEIVREKPLADYLQSKTVHPSIRESAELEIFDHCRHEMRVFHANTSPVKNHKGEITGLLSILRDITHERQVDRLKSDLISTAAHELRTPLTSILGYAEFLLYQEGVGGFDAEEQREFLAEIYEKAEGLSRTVNEMLDISRIESGQGIAIDRSLCRVEESVKRVVRDFQRLCPDRSFELALEDPSAEFWVDQGKFIRIMENLLSNAVKYSPGGGPVRISVESAGERIRFVVKDHGIGMTPEQTERIFDRFYRADTSDTAVGGLGLGMSIVHSIVTSHGGTISVQSSPGQGTTVTFDLPTGCPTIFPNPLVA